MTDPTQQFVLIDIDTQRDLIAANDSAVPFIQRLIGFARENSIPVLSTVRAGAEKLEGTEIPGAVRLAGEKGSTSPNPLPPQVILETPKADLFSSSAAMTVIEQLYGRTAVIFGVGLEEGIRAAMLGLRRHGLPCRIVRDALTIGSQDSAARAERDIMESGSLLVSTDAILARMEQQIATPST